MKAEEAREKTNFLKNQIDTQEYKEMIILIKEAIAKAEFQVTKSRISSFLKERLEYDGYDIKNMSDPRDHYTEYTISWK